MNKPEPTRIEYPLTNATIHYTDSQGRRVAHDVSGRVVVLSEYTDVSNLAGPAWMPGVRYTQFDAIASGEPVPADIAHDHERSALKAYLAEKLSKFLDTNLADLRLEAEKHLNDLADGYLKR